ncbi:hypothetical protein R70006_06223 [Paraburkholderia domus]|uniref:hypothetical protein n=1 Tax=Paraburkholderia domus TaxID=2793075 RepID=UPI0019145ECB|nr:hypothetical protein [Paraburkholderia domus]MBK5052854.1 hypothetical protein [Burkholderia sp. R-70006]CAE6821534.1 hypothetical protein R70006_06223 [Paraburkholderia domus]
MQVISSEQARQTLRAAYTTGKNVQCPQGWVPPEDRGRDWVVVNLPLDWIAPNSSAERYDSTVDLERACFYAAGSDQFPPVHLLYGARLYRRDIFTAAVMDGGHRVTAARMRGDERIAALMLKDEFEQLLAARANLSPQTEPAATTAQPEEAPLP